MEKVILLFSSGLDSYMANYYLTKMKEKGDIKQLKRIYFELGNRYSKNEVEFLQKKHGNKNITFIDFSYSLYLGNLERPDYFIPHRNILLTTLASAKYPDYDTIIINGMKDDRVSDNNKELFDKFSIILSDSINKPIEIKSLFWNVEKTNVVMDYSALNVKEKLLTDTYSCFNDILITNDIFYEKDENDYKQYKATFYGCLSCPACFRKNAALTSANIYVPFTNKIIVDKYRNDETLKDYPNRYESTIKYINFLDQFLNMGGLNEN